MKKIISISIDETTLKNIDKARGLASRSKFIETILFIKEWKDQSNLNNIESIRTSTENQKEEIPLK